MTSLVNNIVRVLSIAIEWSESSVLEDGVSFTSVGAFEQAIQRAAIFAPKGGAYDKTSFVIVAKTDEGTTTYKGRVDIVPEMASWYSLGEHIVDHCSFVLECAELADQHGAARAWHEFARVLRDAKLEIAQEEREAAAPDLDDASCGFARLCVEAERPKREILTTIKLGPAPMPKKRARRAR